MHVPFRATSPFGEGWGEVWDERSGGVSFLLPLHLGKVWDERSGVFLFYKNHNKLYYAIKEY